MLGQATKASHFHPGLCQRLWDSKAGTWTKKIINLAKKIARFEAEPDVIGKVSLDIVALVCPVERHTIPRHTKCAAAQPVHSLPQLDQLVSHCDLEQATKSLQQFFPWAELGSKRMSQILTILIDICNLTSHIFEWASKKHNCLTAPFFTLTPKVGLKHLGATHCLLMLPHTSHLLGQASEAHECKGNPPASCAAGARHQSIHFGMRATAWLIHVLKNTPFTSISWILVDGAARVPTQWIIKSHGN